MRKATPPKTPAFPVIVPDTLRQIAAKYSMGKNATGLAPTARIKNAYVAARGRSRTKTAAIATNMHTDIVRTPFVTLSQSVRKFG